MAKKKMAKAAVAKAHTIARRIPKGSVDNPYAVGMAAEKRHLRALKAKKAKKASRK
jgi:hypothetical protein